MVSNKPTIQVLIKRCFDLGIRDVVISPGSRNAPINISFHGHGGFRCQTVTDERVAAFIGLGMSMQTNMPTVLVCTSGTAALNYAPAIAEAYYQKIPMLILTADRPEEFIDQGIGQTIRQQGLYQNYIKASYHLMEDTFDDTQQQIIDHNDRIITQAIANTLDRDHGPVHINIPLREPLYDVLSSHDNLYDYGASLNINSKSQLGNIIEPKLIDIWNSSVKKLIIIGQTKRDSKLNEILNKYSNRSDTIILCETTSHVFVDHFIQHIDRVIDSIPLERIDDFNPDLIISIGGAVVSKKIKVLLRNANAKHHWHVGDTDFFPDTYGSLSHKVQMNGSIFLEKILGEIKSSNYKYSESWLFLNKLIMDGHEDFMRSCPWSDLAVFGYVLPRLREKSVLHLANSTPIRYAQLFDYREDLTYCCNRGVGGIDGSTSTAVGSAMANPNRHVLITGDLSFFYDSNALWIPDFPKNLKIIVINNGGGNIFRIIPGPDSTEILEEVFEAHHKGDVKSIADAYGINHKKVINIDELSTEFVSFLDDNSVQLLEIVTPRLENDRVLKKYFSFLKKSINQYA